MKVIKFGAVWCSGCLVMKPRWSEIEASNPWLETEMYDFDENKDAVNKYNITDILPVFIFLDKNGNEFLRLNGEISKDKLIDIINENKDK
ncbi:MAG: thioredoxin 1 [Patescibacteria group bacterium]|nr:thioredoxin 1 [Patescibacteria group bacterium]